MRELAEPQDDRPLRMISVGRLSRQKGFDVLLRALARARLPAGIQAWIVGDGPERTALHYLAVGDIDATVARLRERGVEIDTEPHVIFGHDDDTLGPAGTDEWMAFVRDSEGNLVGLVEERPRSTDEL